MPVGQLFNIDQHTHPLPPKTGNLPVTLLHATIFRDCVLDSEAKAAATMFFATTLLEEGLSECVRGVAEESVTKAWQERFEHLERLRIVLERKQLLKYWKR